MLDILHRVEKELPGLLRDATGWNSVNVNYHPPIVHRLWRQWGEYRVYLHRIYPCKPEEALFHSHPWPSAVHVLSGTYLMNYGYGPDKKAPPKQEPRLMTAGSQYEMIDPSDWHDVAPIFEPSLSLMVTGKPWKTDTAPKSSHPLTRLLDEEIEELLRTFRHFYPSIPRLP